MGCCLSQPDPDLVAADAYQRLVGDWSNDADNDIRREMYMAINANGRVSVVEEHRCLRVGPKCFCADSSVETRILRVKAVEPDGVVRIGACWRLWYSVRLGGDGEALLVNTNTGCVGRQAFALRRTADKRGVGYFNAEKQCGKVVCLC
ncbi:unnamed protein product [Ostreobium quekettii]|uniref:Uncharacterized protein n=1 Tax=Ostreobium quekettii TaxID=121088 RepID=A0A8S1J9F3_9CHLO|nr:unnamed protein product [Ostreobium quekettii]|eukprot:evm.model.scf_1143.6 EVM.evm.TU.scf_1143.6   scf_1143:33789-34232(+)